MAKGAGVPLLLVAFDFNEKAFKLLDTFYLTEDMEADVRAMQMKYKSIHGKFVKTWQKNLK